MNPANAETLKYLSQLRGDLTTFNPDQVQMVKGYLPKTNLKTNLVNVLSNMRIDLISNSDRELTGKFKQLKADLIGHVDKRISRLQNPTPLVAVDPWIALEVKTQDATLKLRCQNASTHVDDLLFACKEVIAKQLDGANQVEAEEVREFRQNNLPIYLQLIQSSQKTEESISLILKGFEQLEDSLKKAEYTKADAAARQIDSSLQTFALALAK